MTPFTVAVKRLSVGPNPEQIFPLYVALDVLLIAPIAVYTTNEFNDPKLIKTELFSGTLHNPGPKETAPEFVIILPLMVHNAPTAIAPLCDTKFPLIKELAPTPMAPSATQKTFSA